MFWTPEIPGVTDGFSLDHPEVPVLLTPNESRATVPDERIYVCGPCSSVLDVAMHLARQGDLGPWDSVLATRQWAGRGQMRRNWVSDAGNLFAAWRLPMPPEPWQGLLPVLLGWILCRGLAELGVPARLKWPNDLLVGGRKVGGILIEERGDMLLAGIGLNLNSCPGDEDLRRDRACPAARLGDLLPELSIFGLWLRLVHSGRLRYSALLSDSTPQEFSQLIETVLAYFGSVVRVGDNRSSVCGVCTGISPDGGVVLLVDGRKLIVRSGSLRPED
jgi:BirA family biotin operon repressor/biotin-[acetyl-CoA-carboxylase] ligase